MNLKTLSILLLLMTLLLPLIACGGEGQNVDTPTSAEVQSADPELDIQFRDAVEEYVKNSWSLWALGESIGQCFITNADLMTPESKQAIIEHGIDEAFDKLSGEHLGSLSKVWDLCESATTTAATATIQPTPAPIAQSTPAPMIEFESTLVHENFPDGLQQQFKNAVDEHFDAATEKAGISVAIYQNGYLWRYAKGKASSSADMTVGTPTLVRSTSKTFLAGLVLQQIDEGLYSLSDTLGSVLSENEEYETLDENVINPDVTIEQLLTMTSGIENVKDYYGAEVTALQESRNWRPVDVVRLVITNFGQPGTYQYSNTNSMLLGLVAEHAGGQQLNELYKSALFDPLGIVAILLPQDAPPPPDTARPHGDRSKWGGTGFGDIMESSHYGADWYSATNKTTWAAAGMVTTPENMAIWAYELLSDHGSALSPIAQASLLDSFTGPLISIGGTEPEHQYGYHVTRTTLPLSDGSITAYGHPGSGGGYTSDFFYSPELDMSISLLVNSHSDARTRAEAEGTIGHRTLGDIAWQILDTYNSQ